MERRLAAILAADVVGYSRLMGEDEAGTLAALKATRNDLIYPKVVEYNGRMVKLMGDGALVEFPSVVDAVAFAIETQSAMQARNAGVPDDQQILYRVGINIGDVIVDGEDIYGDGVNVAARLESLADPGGICVSETVRDQVLGKVQVEWSGGDEVELKNIERLIRAWHWSPGERDTAKSTHQRFGRWRPTIAVLPFGNLSGDPDQDYFADGLTEDLVTALTHWRSFPVVARNSSFTYKGKTVAIPQVAQELGANYVVEGTVRKAGPRVRVTAQLIDGASGHHVWARRYDRDLADIFEVQDDLTHSIAAVLAPEVSRAEFKRSALKRPNDLDAWDHWLRGDAALGRETPEAMQDARGHFEQAIALDPEYSDAYTGVAHSYNKLLRMGAIEDRAEALRRSIDAAKRAIECDPESSRAHYALSTSYILQNEHDLALAEARLSVELNPNDPYVLHGLGNKSDLAGELEGIERMELAQRLNPRDPSTHVHLTFLARAYVNVRDYPAAIARARAAISRYPEYAPAYFILAIALAHEDRLSEAAAALERCDALSPGFVAKRAEWHPYMDEASNEHLKEGLKRAKAAVASPN